MLHYTVKVRGDLEQDPQVFEGLHMLNRITFKHKLLAWVSKIEHHDFFFFQVHYKSTFVATLILGLRPKQGFAKVQAKTKPKSHISCSWECKRV
jgi:hypothetical protein